MSVEQDMIRKLLERNNWLPPNASAGESTLRDRLEAYARFHGLNPTAPSLPELVIEHAKQPRCSLPDLRHVYDPTAPRKRADVGCKWPHKQIRFWHDMSFSNVPQAALQAAVDAALASWEAVCGIQFVKHPTKSGANIFAHARNIDGPSNVLAWSMLPCGQTEQGWCEQRYDLEPWPQYGTDWRGLQEVVAHEVGHALGLDHLPAGNLLQPYATFEIVIPQAGDIAEVRARYGPPSGSPPVDPPPGDNPPPVGGNPVLLGHWAMDLAYTQDRYRLVLVNDGPAK